MARIKAEDIQAVKERASLEDVVREHVTLRGAGVGSLKGLCPFHEERTPSFTIRPAVGYFHCFGCGEGGDVLDFIQKIDHLTFAEAVERLADRLGITLRYEEGAAGGQGPSVPVGQRTRLMEAHRVAQDFYHEALVSSAEGAAARTFLQGKGFSPEHAEHFLVGYSPQHGRELTQHLRSKGFNDEELVIAGLASRGSHGTYDRFRGRVMWPIRAITGDVVGFGARRLYEDDRIAAKYLNTSETPIYKKTGVLYGLDLAKKAIATQRRAVIVEGYTDVMACHLAGIETAVATCGTAFGTDHITILRRILRDEVGHAPARVIFTFDGDAAGQKAAMKAFEQDQRWAAQSFVAIVPGEQDPNDLWKEQGADALHELVESASPLFEFAIRTTLAPYDLNLATERVMGMRAIAPMLAGIKDRGMQPEYVRDVAGLMGVDPEALFHEVAQASRGAASPQAQRRVSGHAAQPGSGGSGGDANGPAESDIPMPNLRDPVQVAERHLLQVMLQFPLSIVPEDMDELEPGVLRAPAHQAIWYAARMAGGIRAAAGLSSSAWPQAVAMQTAPVLRDLVMQLAVAPIPTKMDPGTGMPTEAYVDSLVLRVRLSGVERLLDDRLSARARLEPGAVQERALDEELMNLHRERARLRARME